VWEYNYNYLSHHGVKGQKWGNRNYQYEDGSLTPEGRIHYKQSLKSAKKEYKSSKQDIKKNSTKILGIFRETTREQDERLEKAENKLRQAKLDMELSKSKKISKKAKKMIQQIEYDKKYDELIHNPKYDDADKMHEKSKKYSEKIIEKMKNMPYEEIKKKYMSTEA
jgi:hypothetical protein